MKKTKTGLHIQTRKNRIEVYTQKELEEQERKLMRQRDTIMQLILILMFLGIAVVGFLIGKSV
jgi:predicted nucleic acid-binding Zn ribbon protein|tara:strand:- start:7941 stop:8129 length:189 start_codon:yes stop_codon:yes gene_type:complete